MPSDPSAEPFSCVQSAVSRLTTTAFGSVWPAAIAMNPAISRMRCNVTNAHLPRAPRLKHRVPVCIGRMRHGEALIEVARQVGVLRQQDRRRAARETLAV